VRLLSTRALEDVAVESESMPFFGIREREEKTEMERALLYTYK
jgi:hypothetical protein